METKLAARERPKDDPTPPPAVHQDVKGVKGNHVNVDTVNAVGIMNQNTTIVKQDQDAEESLKLNIKTFEERLKTHRKKLCETELTIQKLEDGLLKQQQDCATTGGTRNVQDQINELKEKRQTHESEIARLEIEVLPELKAKLHQVQEQLAKYETTAQDKMKDIPVLKKEMEILKRDLDKYGDDIARESTRIADLSVLIQQLEKEMSDQGKGQKSKIQQLEKDMSAMGAMLKELQQCEATHVKTIQDLTEQKEKASTEPSKIPSQSESVSHFPQTTQESDQHASSDQSQSEIIRRHPAKNQAASNAPSQTARTPVTTTKKPATQATPSPADCEDLYDASSAGNLEEVKRILSRGVDVNCRWGVWSRTPVLAAAWRGHRDVVELLVRRGADVSLVDRDGDNILHLACMGGHVEMVEFALSLNVVDINARNNYGRTAAYWARSMGHTRVADLLVSRGAQ